MLIAMGSLIFMCGTGISAGYHRFYAHKAYKLNKAVEVVILFFGTLAAQNSVLKWCHDHRNHHMHLDTEKDPYSIKKGFWHAHILWIMKKDKDFDPKVVSDLMRNKLVVFQHDHYLALMAFTNALTIVFFGGLFNDYFGAFVLVFLMRLFIAHHSTFFINSLAHVWGSKQYSRVCCCGNRQVVAARNCFQAWTNTLCPRRKSCMDFGKVLLMLLRKKHAPAPASPSTRLSRTRWLQNSRPFVMPLEPDRQQSDS